MNDPSPLKLTVVDYGMGNLRSVWKMAVQSGADVKVSADPDDIKWAEKLVLPGVGAFPDAMKSLGERDLLKPLHDAVMEDKKPILGICLGMELMCHHSTEVRPTDGLGWLDAEMVPFDSAQGIRVPHVGWNTITKPRPSEIMDDIEDGSFFYFVHSYHMRSNTPDLVVATADYGGSFTAAVESDNIFGTQFHPEKSQAIGSAVMANFILHGQD